MTFRIERVVGGESEIVLRVCGRAHIECVNILAELIETESAKLVLDLSEVTLADHDTATFLAACELKGIRLKKCPHFFVVGFPKNMSVLSGCSAMTTLLRVRAAIRSCSRNHACAGSVVSRGCQAMKKQSQNR